MSAGMSDLIDVDAETAAALDAGFPDTFKTGLVFGVGLGERRERSRLLVRLGALEFAIEGAKRRADRWQLGFWIALGLAIVGWLR